MHLNKMDQNYHYGGLCRHSNSTNFRLPAVLHVFAEYVKSSTQNGLDFVILHLMLLVHVSFVM